MCLRSLLLPLVLLLSSSTDLSAKGVLDNLTSVRHVSGYESADIVKDRMSSRPLHEIEGLWEMAGEGSLMAIERTGDTNGASALYRMIIVKGASLSLREGTVMGYLTPSSQRGHYQARIYSDLSDDHTILTRLSNNTIILNDDGSRISFKPQGRKFRFNWWRMLLPYMYRSVITPLERRDDNLDGCIRVFPYPANPLNPRYL